MKRLALFAALLAYALSVAARDPQNNFRFSIVGDRTGSPQPQVYGRVWREVDLLHPDFVINAGDVIEGGDDAQAESQWRSVKAVWQRYSYPLFFTPGNHDIWSARSAAVYEKMTGRPPQYSFNYGDAHFVVLDNSRREALSAAQLEFLAKDLENNRERSPKFVFFHNPTVWLVPLKFQNYDFPLHALARKYGVTAVISGHTHQFARMEHDGIVYLTLPSSGGHLRGSDFAQGWFYGHVLATVKGSHVWFTVKEIDGPLGKGRLFGAGSWGENGPKFDAGDPAIAEKPAT